MRHPIIYIVVVALSSCSMLPQISSDIEKIANNDAVTIKCDKDCFQKDTDVSVVVEIKNKDASHVVPTAPSKP